MPGPVYIKKRLYNPELVIDTNKVLPNGMRMKFNGEFPMTYVIDWTGTCQAAAEELGTSANSVKDGTTTPFVPVLACASNSDKRTTAAGMVHSVALIGITVSSVDAYVYRNETPLATVEVLATNGTTDVTANRAYLWVDHAYACEWGTGATHDAEGDITIEEPADTDLLTIKATYNESMGGVWHFPTGYFVSTKSVESKFTATAAAADGSVVQATYTSFDQILNDASNNDIEYYPFIMSEGIFKYIGRSIPRYTTKASKVVWAGADTANTPVMTIQIIQECIKY